jgi:hypothetical protein
MLFVLVMCNNAPKTILDIMHCPLYYLKHRISEAGVSPCSDGTCSDTIAVVSDVQSVEYIWEHLRIFYLKKEKKLCFEFNTELRIMPRIMTIMSVRSLYIDL